MLRWWADQGVHRADLAVRRHDRLMIWHHDLELDRLPLAWARAQNARGSEIYIRPARGHSWPLVLVDDVELPLARTVAARSACLIIRTSPVGGCHLWIRCTEALDETRRQHLQRHLAQRLAGDLAATSGEHLGRLAGFKNWKRGGCWVNLLQASSGPHWQPLPLSSSSNGHRHTTPSDKTSSVDHSPSAREWGWTCAMLEAGVSPPEAHRRLLERARIRRKRQPERYAERTLERALTHVARSTNHPRPNDF